MRVIFILRGDTKDALWAAEKNLKRRIQIEMGINPTVTWANPSPAQFISLSPDDCVVSASLATLLGLEPTQVQYPGEVIKGQWGFLFRNPPGRFIFCDEPEGNARGVLDTNTNAAKIATWALRFRPTPLDELPGVDKTGRPPYSVKAVYDKENGVRQIIPDEKQEEIEDLMIRLYKEDMLSYANIERYLEERNIRGPRGGKYTKPKISQILKKRGVKPRRSKIRVLMAKEDTEIT